jgi:hypothetical protein
MKVQPPRSIIPFMFLASSVAPRLRFALALGGHVTRLLRTTLGCTRGSLSGQAEQSAWPHCRAVHPPLNPSRLPAFSEALFPESFPAGPTLRHHAAHVQHQHDWNASPPNTTLCTLLSGHRSGHAALPAARIS